MRRIADNANLNSSLESRKDEVESLSGSAQLRTNKGSAFLALQSDLETQRGNYFGNAQSGFVWTRAGLDFTPANSGEAAIIYVNDSAARSEPADALLANRRIGTVRPQQRLAQPVSAFRKSAIGILPSRGTSLSGSNKNREATLFPGTVAILAAELAHVTAVFGRLTEPTGAVIGNATLTGTDGESESDTDGYFQIDVAGSTSIAVRRSDGTSCRIQLAPQSEVAVYDAGDINCHDMQ